MEKPELFLSRANDTKKSDEITVVGKELALPKSNKVSRYNLIKRRPVVDLGSSPYLSSNFSH